MHTELPCDVEMEIGFNLMDAMTSCLQHLIPGSLLMMAQMMSLARTASQLHEVITRHVSGVWKRMWWQG
jgi:hypothetical protein